MSLLGIAASIAAVLLLLAFVAVAWRVLFGPSAADRVIGIDMLGLLAIAFAALAAVFAGHGAFLDVALGIAVVGFLAAAAFALVLDRTPGAEDER